MKTRSVRYFDYKKKITMLAKILKEELRKAMDNEIIEKLNALK